MFFSLFPYPLPLIILLITWSAKAAQVVQDITLDDALVTYDPPDAWNSNSYCPHVKCYAQPDPNTVWGGTWHESTFRADGAGANNYPNTPLSATARFHGNAVKVYAVLPPNFGAVRLPRTASLRFFIDGVSVGEFSHPEVGDYIYGVLIYENPSLPLGSHELKITNGQTNGEESLLILDRIIYSTVVVDSTLPGAPGTTAVPSSTAHSIEIEKLTSSVTVTDHLTDPSPTHSLNQTTTMSSSLGHPTHSSTTPNSPAIYSPLPTQSPSPTPPTDAPNNDNIPPNHPLSTGAIIGAALGSFVGIILILLVVVYCRRHRRQTTIKRQGVQLPSPLTAPEHQTYSTRSLAGWVVASDSKKDILTRAGHAPPPAYHL